MKAAKFDYVLAESIEQAVAALAAGNGDAIIIAGGQSLMPMLAMRLATPATVVDINNIAQLSGIEAIGGEVVIKACTRQATALASPLVQMRLPLLAKAISHVGHQQTRNRGTVGGSLSHADPASEIPLAALAMDARVSLRSVAGTREVALADFFLGPMMTARADNEILLKVHFPEEPDGPDGSRMGTAFHEVSERHGDFAVVAAAAQIQLDANGRCIKAALALGGVNGVPRRIPALEARLRGTRIDPDAVRAVLPEIADAITPGDDQHASAAYRRRVAGVLAERALLEAVAEAAP
ncbi:MAG: xanthine dehydrogenase family protein subunit M [Proteobacteria bacterium]|nr:xanthine dehydrogenase family protein subunit M [Pseudomonadota bacterium]